MINIDNLFKSHFIPSTKPSQKLMIVLHGRGDSIEPFKEFDKELNVDFMNFLLIQAPHKCYDGYSWYHEPPHKNESVLEVRKKIFKMIELLDLQGWKSENVFFFGFSQGCLISSDVVLNYPKKLGGVIGVSGYFHFFPRWKNFVNPENIKTPWLFSHGRKDKILDIKETKFGVSKLKNIGYNVEWFETNKDHSLIEREYPVFKDWLIRNNY